MERHVPVCLINLLANWYENVFTSVRWGQSLSKLVRLRPTTGVRQDGALSPVLFAVYVNDIITCVESSGYGCEIAGKCVGILMYADDLLLISATCNGLIRLIEIGEQEMAWLDMQFNARKSCMVRRGPRHNKEYADILLNGVPLIRGKTFNYLGILFEVGRELKISLAAKRMKFFRAFNYTYGCVGATASPMVLCHLLGHFTLTSVCVRALPVGHL